MNKSSLYGAAWVFALVFSFISIPSHAELIDNGDGLIYDTVLDITWAQSRNLATTSWDDANTYAEELTLGEASDWRLPYISVEQGAGPTAGANAVDCSSATEEACRDNELGYMFYQNLSGTEGDPVTDSGDPDLALFPTLNPFIPYWSGTEVSPDTAWEFNFGDGRQSNDIPKSRLQYAWAVHDGNVGGGVAILIDDFENSRQTVPDTGDSTPRSSELEVPTALGGWRRLDQIEGDNLIIVDQADNLGFDTDAGVLYMSDGGKFGGRIQAEWSGDGGNGLGGIDLTAGGDRFQLRGVVLAAAGDALLFNFFEVRVTDIFGQESSFRTGWDDVRRDLRPLSGLAYFIPFSSLSQSEDSPGEADLSEVNSIVLYWETTPISLGAFSFDSFSVVPEPTGDLPPKADAGEPVSGEAGTLVNFFADGSISDDEITTYRWDFGDGNFDEGVTVNHTYGSSGTYLVDLTVTDTKGISDSDTTTATIGANASPPVADAGGPYEGTVGAVVVFNGDESFDPGGLDLQYDWDFGDGNTAIDGGPNPTNTYASSGTFDVTLTVTDEQGEADTAITSATIAVGNQPPVADAGPPAVGITAIPVTFDGGDSSDPEDGVLRYDWDYGDGSAIDMDAGPEPSHTYTLAGDYTVTLTVTDDLNAIDTAQTAASINDIDLPPIADPGGSYSGLVGDEILFDGGGSRDLEGPIASYEWDFGDGSPTATGETTSYTYGTADDYTVTLTVTDGEGQTDDAETTASIGTAKQPPVADAGESISGLVDTLLVFDGSESFDPDGQALSGEWDFGDSNNGNSLVNLHTYAAAGLYRATLTVTDSDNLTDTDSILVVISEGSAPPTADANGPYPGVAGTAVTLDGSASEDSDGVIASHDWDFGDLTSGTGETVDHTYGVGDIYNVTLQVTDDDDLVASDSTIAVIGETSELPTADAGGPYTGTVGVEVAFDASASMDPDGTIERYDWDYGDTNGEADAGPTPSHAYLNDGKYIVKVTVTDNSGEVATDRTTVVVGIGNQSPQADAGDPVTGTVGRDITFDGTGSRDPDGSVDKYAWSFGDGATGAGKNPTHRYAVAGRYFVVLTVTDNDGAVSSNVTLCTQVPKDTLGSIGQVASDLEGLLPTGDKKDDHQIEKALEHLNKAMNPEYWYDIDRVNNEKVFKELKKAVKDLKKVKTVDVSEYIEALAAAAAQLASTAIADAEAVFGDAKKIGKAWKEVGKAEAKAEDGKYDKAIEDYRKAWKHAKKAT